MQVSGCVQNFHEKCQGLFETDFQDLLDRFLGPKSIPEMMGVKF